MAVKVAVTGTHEVGKTILIQAVKDKLPSNVLEKIKFPPELAIDIINGLDFKWRETDKDAYRHFEKCLFNYYCLSAKLPVSFLSDRLPVDVFAYWTYILREPIPKNMIHDLLNTMRNYDYIYFYKEENLDSERGFIQEQIETWLLKVYHLIKKSHFAFYRKNFDEIVDEITGILYQGVY